MTLYSVEAKVDIHNCFCPVLTYREPRSQLGTGNPCFPEHGGKGRRTPPLLDSQPGRLESIAFCSFGKRNIFLSLWHAHLSGGALLGGLHPHTGSVFLLILPLALWMVLKMPTCAPNARHKFYKVQKCFLAPENMKQCHCNWVIMTSGAIVERYQGKAELCCWDARIEACWHASVSSRQKEVLSWWVVRGMATFQGRHSPSSFLGRPLLKPGFVAIWRHIMTWFSPGKWSVKEA
jgi:hypothetical protein